MGGSVCDTVHILSGAAGESVNEKCCHTNNEWCILSHYVLYRAAERRGFVCIFVIVLKVFCKLSL